MPTPDVRQMTTGIHAGDEAAFDAFYDTYAARMLRYLLVVARGDEAAAHDVRQDALLRVVRYMKEMPSDEDAWRYLTVCMRSAWLDRQRTRKAAERRNRPLVPQDEQRHAFLGEDEATDRLHDLLAGSLADLSGDDRALIEASYFHGTTQMDLAALQAVPVKTLAMRLVRVRRAMRAFILRGLNHE